MSNTQTVQTGQEKKRTPFIEIRQSPTTNLWYWCLWAGNGRQLAISAVGYENRKLVIGAARNACEAMKVAQVITETH